MSLVTKRLICESISEFYIKVTTYFSFIPEANDLNCFMTDRRVNQETANFRYNVYLIYDQKLTDKPQFYFSSYAYFHINILAPFKMQIFK